MPLCSRGRVKLAEWAGERQPRLQREAPLLALSEGSKHLGRHAQAELGIQALVLRHLRLKENPHTPVYPAICTGPWGRPAG